MAEEVSRRRSASQEVRRSLAWVIYNEIVDIVVVDDVGDVAARILLG